MRPNMQGRVGPYCRGGRYGWAQLIADGVKFIQQEDIIRPSPDRPVFKWAPPPGLPGGPWACWSSFPAPVDRTANVRDRRRVGFLRAGIVVR